MADKKILLKRNNAGTIDNLFPVARITDMVESDGTTSFLDAGKIRSGYLPSYVIGGLRFYATQSLATSTSLSTIFNSLINFSTTSADAALKIGSYVVVTTGGELTTNNATIGSVAGYQLNAPGDEEDSTTPIILEAGDWIVFRAQQRTGSGGTLELYYYFDIINNTYQDATTSAKGIVTLSGASNVLAYNVSTNPDGITNGGNKVITENNLFDMMGTTSGTIARGDHLHTNVYQPADASLTNLDTFMTGAGNGFIKKTAENTYSLDTNTYSLSTHVHGNITNDGKIGSTADLVVVTGSAGLLTTQSRSGIDSRSTFPVAVATTTVLGGITVNYSSTETNRAVTLSGNDAYVTLPRQIPAVTLNNASSTSPSFYAPTSSGTTGSTSQVKQRLNAVTGAAPTWIDAPVIYYDTTAGSTHGDIIFDEVA